MGKFILLKMTCIVFALCTLTAIASTAQTFTTLVSFDLSDGAGPTAGLVQGPDGNFYGTTSEGGTSNNCTYGCGTVFKITPSGMLTSLHSFDGTDGSSPTGLVLGSDGNFYGTTADGGANNNCTYGCGTVFKITAKGTLTTLHSFNGTDGSYAYWLVQATNGTFYGTTYYGGANNNCTNGCGTVFKITAKGTLTTLHNFNGTDGYLPTGLVQGTNGNFYGTTLAGGANNDGSVYKMTTKGTLTTLHGFDSGYGPTRLIQGTDGNFYGVTEAGGLDLGGTVFKITANGVLTTLYNFGNDSLPTGVVEGTDGNFYGTTQFGGRGLGTVFQITSMGVFTSLHNFSANDGADPLFAPVQGTDGTFYGTTYSGGNKSNYGTVFSLSMGLGPFIETLPNSGNIGRKVIILGNDLSGASSVTFNGTVATFKVNSNTKITTKVPTGATTGFVAVTTPNGTLTSNVQFLVP